MVITRRLLLPTLAVFAILLVGLAVFFGANASRTLQTEENRYLLNLAQVFDQEIKGKSDVTLALAKQIATNPEVIRAFSESDRLQLTTLTLNSYNAIKNIYGITSQQFVARPATVLLRLQQIERFGDDLTGSRSTLVNSISLGEDISGLELSDDGLGLRGVAYMEAGGVDGAVDLGISIDEQAMNSLKSRYGSEWQFFLSQEAMAQAGYTGAPGMEMRQPGEGAAPGLSFQGGTLPDPILAPAEAYRQAIAGQTVISRVQSGPENAETAYSIITMPLKDFSDRVVGAVDIVVDRSAALAALRGRIALTAGLSIFSLIIIGLLVGLIVQRTLWPVQQLNEVSRAFATGDLQRRLSPRLEERSNRNNPDEIDQLTRSYTAMADQLRRLVGNLEDRVAERTQDLERRTEQMRAVADITRNVTTVTNVQSLLDEAVQLVRQRFNFYHAGVFILDEEGEYAVLRAATGEAGRQMIENGHKLRVLQGLGETAQGVVGATASAGRPHVTQDVEADPAHYKNPLLPETRSEIGLPLRLGAKVIGVLDVQSNRPNAYDEGDIAVLQILADQLAIAFNNARLISELNRSISELEQAYASITRQTWASFVRQKNAGGRVTGYRYQRSFDSAAGSQMAVAGPAAGLSSADWTALRPVSSEALDEDVQRALVEQAPVVSRPGESQGSSLAVPIRLRDQTIGVVTLRFETPAVPAEIIGLVEDIGRRLGLVLESARLLHEAQRLAAREQQINVISTQMRSSVDMDSILQSTVRELGKALGARRTFISIGQQPAIEAVVEAGSEVEMAAEMAEAAAAAPAVQKPPADPPARPDNGHLPGQNGHLDGPADDPGRV